MRRLDGQRTHLFAAYKKLPPTQGQAQLWGESRQKKAKGPGKKAAVMVLIFDQIVLKLNLVIRDKFILVKGTIH